MHFVKADSPIEFPKLGIKLDPPTGFSIGNFFIAFYAVIIAVGLVLAVVYALKRRRQFGLRENDILDGVLCIVPFAIICARLYYVAFEWDSYKANPVEILNIRNGGLAIYGGVIAAAIGVVVLCLIKKIKIGAVLDITSLGFLIGQSIGRWGNFFNREAFGSYSNNFLAMRIKSQHLPKPDVLSAQFIAQRDEMVGHAVTNGYIGQIQVHPTFLYESIWNLVGFAALHFLSKKRKYDGQIALAYVAWYGLGRTFIEGYRMDSLYWGNFRVSQMLAAITCFVAVAILVWQAFRYHDPKKLYVNMAGDKLAAEDAKRVEDAAKAKARREKFFGKKANKGEEEISQVEETVEESTKEEAEESVEAPSEEAEETEE